MLTPRACPHGACLFCPSLKAPQSYTPESPAVLRAKSCDYDAFKQTKQRVETLEEMGHPTDKIELIIMGGTFLSYPKEFQIEFIKKCYDALNGQISKTLEQAQKINETTKHRCIALCIETRPDVCIKHIDKMRKWGVTRVELGVQIIDDKIYKKVKRSHTVKDVINATKALKDAGFKIGYHIMPGLPGSNPKKDIQLFKKMFSNQNFKPDQLKLYPCQVMPGSELEKMYWDKKYLPYTEKIIKEVLIKMLKIIPNYCRVMRIMREIPTEYLVAGTTNIGLRKDLEEELKKQKVKLKEIRYREIGFADKASLKKDVQLKITKYKASQGAEYFLEIINKDNILFGLLRLRISKAGAIVREVHVYGQSLELGQIGDNSQHTGLGKQLIAKAEELTKKSKHNKLKIISGIGVREYYKKLGYILKDTYMVKNLN
jgi:elongator complex protein 3